jgi:hypothetical protein
MERLTAILGYAPYRCHQCDHRFQISRHPRSEPGAPASPDEKEIAATLGTRRWKKRRLEIWLYFSALTLFAIVLYFMTRPPSVD